MAVFPNTLRRKHWKFGEQGMNNIAGQHIKGYELQERIGAGGFGAVYRAYQSTIGREVAMKIILPGYANHPDFIRRFEAEAHVIARLEHPYIVPLHDYWRDPDGAYLVMRYLRGGSLHDSLQKQGAFSVEETVNLMEQVTQALHIAHRNQVIHRDIKPGNILLDEDGNAYLADFGIAKDHTISQSITDPDGIIGSPDYLAPEQARSESVTPQTDIYSLGVVLYEILKGKHPFPAQSPIERLYNHLNEPLPEIVSLDDTICNAVNEVIQKATAKNPQQRFKDVIAFAQALREAAALTNSAATTSLVELLTPREQEVLKLVIEGKSNREIADTLVIEISTVKSYINQLYRKLNVRSRVQAIVKARELDLIVGKAQTQALTSSSNLPEPENPYKGLRAFQAADAQDFFGREKLTQKLLKRLEETTENHRFLAVVGPSGSGKSSVVKAGLIPALWRGELPNSDNWYIVDMLPGDRPLDELEVALFRVADDRSLNLREQLERDAHGLLRVADLILPDAKSELLLVIDQFEEVFTLVADENERLHFLNLLHEAVTRERSRIRVIVTLRADYYDRPLQYPDFGELIRNRVETILPLSAEELEHAVREPASSVGVRFEDGLVSRIVADVHYQPGALPLLQYALTELFERRDGRTLTQTAYQAIGGTGGALANRADEIYLEQDEAGRELIRQIFLRLVTLGEGAEDTRRRVPRSELLAISGNKTVGTVYMPSEKNMVEVMDEIIDLYAASRLLSLDNDPATRTPTVEVAHEAILREWERLRTWLNASREDIRQQRIVAQAAEAWQTNKRDASYLMSGTRLEQVEKWHQSTELALTPLERDFIAASTTERTSHQKAETERQAREIRLEHRSRNFLRGLVAVFAIATLLAIGLSAFAFNQSQIAQTERDTAQAERDTAQIERQRAETQSRIAQSRELVGYARENLETDGELSTLLALQAVNLTYAADGTVLPEANTMLHQAVQGFRPPIRIPASGAGEGRYFDFSPDGRQIMYPISDFSVGIADAVTGTALYALPGGAVSLISANNQIALGEGSQFGQVSRLSLWDISSGESGQLLSSFAPATPFNFDWIDATRDLHFLVTANLSAPTQVWGLQTGQEIRTDAILSLPQSNGHPIFSPDGNFMANRNPDGTVSILDTEHWNEVVRLPASSLADPIVFSPSGRAIITKNRIRSVTVWDTITGEERYTVYPSISPNYVALNPDEKQLAIGSRAGTIVIWDTQSQQEVLQFSVSAIAGIIFNNDGSRLATMHDNGWVQIWDLIPGREFLTLFNGNSVPDRRGVSVAYSPDAHRLVVANNDETPIVWDAETGQEVFILAGHTAPVIGVAWSPDAKWIATTSDNDDNTARIWDAATGEAMLVLSGHTDFVYAAAFSPDSKLLATSSGDGTVRVWDVETGQLTMTLEYPGSLRGVTWSPNGMRIAATNRSDGTTRVWNAMTGEVQLELAIGDDQVHAVAFSPDGSRIMTGSHNQRNAYVWDAQTGEKLMTLSGHTDQVGGAAYSPDGTQIATASADGTIRLWDSNTGQELLTLLGSEEGVSRVVFSPDGTHLATQNFDGTTRIYVLPIDDLIALAQSRLTRSLTVEECQRYLHTDVCPTAP
jgi:WD40 repeat protein/serine/threonine protein kinase